MDLCESLIYAKNQRNTKRRLRYQLPKGTGCTIFKVRLEERGSRIS